MRGATLSMDTHDGVHEVAQVWSRSTEVIGSGIPPPNLVARGAAPTTVVEGVNTCVNPTV
eukprot:1867367-Prymnesium_polylepis.1